MQARSSRNGGAPSASRVGANYVPSKDWWWVWQNWSSASVAEDLQAIASLGLDHVRIQCLWPVFQPDQDSVDGRSLDLLDELYSLAARAGLDVIPTVLDGWLSGFDLRPDWLGARNVFRDKGVREAQLRLLSAVATRAAAHENVIALDIGNEINVLAHENPLNAVGRGGADEWAHALVEELRPAAGSLPLLVGVDNRPLTDPESAMSLACAATVGDISSVHAWPYFAGALERFGEDDCGSFAIADYFVQLVRAHQEDPSRPVWVQEFGVSPEWVAPARFESFASDLVRATLTIDDIWGATWWASHDIDPRHPGFDSLEYGLGLLDVHNQPKPAGVILRDQVAALRRGELTPTARSTTLTVQERPRGLEDADEFFAAYRAGLRPRLRRARPQPPSSLRDAPQAQAPSPVLSKVSTPHEGVRQ